MAEKEHIWRLSKKWVKDEVCDEPVHCDEQYSSRSNCSDPECCHSSHSLKKPVCTEEMVPKRLYDELLSEMAGLRKAYREEFECINNKHCE